MHLLLLFTPVVVVDARCDSTVMSPSNRVQLKPGTYCNCSGVMTLLHGVSSRVAGVEDAPQRDGWSESRALVTRSLTAARLCVHRSSPSCEHLQCHTLTHWSRTPSLNGHPRRPPCRTHQVQLQVRLRLSSAPTPPWASTTPHCPWISGPTLCATA